MTQCKRFEQHTIEKGDLIKYHFFKQTPKQEIV